MTSTERYEMTTEPEIVFNMDLANGPTTERFCYEAAAVLDRSVSSSDADAFDNDNDFYGPNDVADYWTNELERAGYAVRWDAGDVVVWDLRPLTDEQRDEFYETLQ